MTKPMLLLLCALPLLACSGPDPDEAVATDSSEVRATSAQNQIAATFRADVSALPLGRGRCTSLGTRPKMTFTVYYPKVASPGTNVVVGTRFEASGTLTQEILLEGKDYPIVFRGDAYGVRLSIGGKPYLLEVYETEGVLRTPDSEEGVPLRCDYEI
jgi:hypothetical protein